MLLPTYFILARNKREEGVMKGVDKRELSAVVRVILHVLVNSNFRKSSIEMCTFYENVPRSQSINSILSSLAIYLIFPFKWISITPCRSLDYVICVPRFSRTVSNRPHRVARLGFPNKQLQNTGRVWSIFCDLPNPLYLHANPLSRFAVLKNIALSRSLCRWA